MSLMMRLKIKIFRYCQKPAQSVRFVRLRAAFWYPLLIFWSVNTLTVCGGPDNCKLLAIKRNQRLKVKTSTCHFELSILNQNLGPLLGCSWRCAAVLYSRILFSLRFWSGDFIRMRPGGVALRSFAFRSDWILIRCGEALRLHKISFERQPIW